MWMKEAKSAMTHEDLEASILLFEEGALLPVWTPYKAINAAALLLQALKEAVNDLEPISKASRGENVL